MFLIAYTVLNVLLILKMLLEVSNFDLFCCFKCCSGIKCACCKKKAKKRSEYAELHEEEDDVIL